MATSNQETGMILIVDAQTGASKEVPMTEAEITQLAKEAAEAAARQAELDAKAAARASALAKLADLGLTAEEIASL